MSVARCTVWRVGRGRIGFRHPSCQSRRFESVDGVNVMRKAFILRYASHEMSAGTEVYGASHCANYEGGPIAVTQVIGVSEIKWMEREELLPRQQYLRNQPIRRYWCLARVKLPSEFEPDEPIFLSDAATEQFGNYPFRFESLGEVVYYMKEHDLKPRDFWIGDFCIQEKL